MTVRRAIAAVLVALALGLVPAAAHADGWVTVRYTGTFDQTFVYQPSNPSVWQATLHFAWDEREVFHLTTPGRVRSEGVQLSITGRQSSTYAPPNSAQSCSVEIAPRTGAPSPILFSWSGSGPAGATALMPITGTYAMSLSATLPSCEIPPTGGAGVGTIPPSVLAVYAKAEDPGISAELGRPPVTRRFDAEGASDDGTNTASLHAKMTVSNSAQRPSDSGATPPQDVAAARKRAKLAALDALRDTLQRALYPCGVGTGVGTALLAAGPVGLAVGGTMTALGTPLCLSYLKTIRDEADTVADPPLPRYRTAARIQPVRAGTVRLPACPRSRGAGSPGAVCRQLGPAAQKLLRATRATAAAAAAIDTTIGRETAALAAHDRTAVALQERTLATLGRSFSARRRGDDSRPSSGADPAVGGARRAPRLPGGGDCAEQAPATAGRCRAAGREAGDRARRRATGDHTRSAGGARRLSRVRLSR